jgi:signal transduction histidine kinase
MEATNPERQLSAPEVVRLIGHELGNRLGVLSNSVYYLNLRLGDGDEKLARHLHLISQEITASSRILANLMDWIGPKEPMREELQPNALVEQLGARNQPHASLEFITTLAEDLPPVYGDAAQLGRALGNLIAYEYTLLPEGGQLGISTSREGPWVVLCLQDTEPPFTPDQAAQLLDLLPDGLFSPVQLGLVVAHNLLAANGCELVIAQTDDLPWRFRVLIPSSQGERVSELARGYHAKNDGSN